MNECKKLSRCRLELEYAISASSVDALINIDDVGVRALPAIVYLCYMFSINEENDIRATPILLMPLALSYIGCHAFESLLHP